MSLENKTVYVANARTGTVDEWTCVGEFNTVKNGAFKERLCFLQRNGRFTTLPKRAVFDTYEAAKAALLSG